MSNPFGFDSAFLQTLERLALVSRHPLSGPVAPLKSLVGEATDLLSMVQGVGPGNSLNAKASNIQSAASKNQTAKVFSALIADTSSR